MKKMPEITCCTNQVEPIHTWQTERGKLSQCAACLDSRIDIFKRQTLYDGPVTLAPLNKPTGD
jgi:hypothetical protein